VRGSGHLGVHAGEVTIDFAAVMAHVKGAIATIEPHDSPERLRSLGIEVIHGDARFVAPDEVEVDGRRLRFRRALISTGASPAMPPIPGLEEVEPLTNETLWGLTERPERLVVLGAGPIGCELGQAFNRLGSQVTLVEMADRILPREEPEGSQLIARHLGDEGVDVRTGTTAVRVEPGGATGGPSGDTTGGATTDGGHHLVVQSGAGEERIGFDRILVAVGRAPRTEGLGLELAQVELTDRGAVDVDDRLQTSNPRIYAAGDITMKLPFTHVASAHGATVVQNALFGLRTRVDHERIPWVTFTSPEVARVGLSVAEARERFGPGISVRTAGHEGVDRAVAAAAMDGFAQLVGDDKGRLVGATVIGPRAGETMGEIVAWMANGAKVSAISRSSTHAYPTWSDDVSQASLQELQASLAKLKPASRVLLWIRRILDR
jgi:pyruvate/2-oxoglutarate dehydrogenase complex dihydrolipoamide dehydrogenase (E3) component